MDKCLILLCLYIWTWTSFLYLVLFASKLLLLDMYKWVELIFGSPKFYTFPSFFFVFEMRMNLVMTDKTTEGFFAELNIVS